MRLSSILNLDVVNGLGYQTTMGMDFPVYHKALQDNKPIQTLESAQEQAEPMLSLEIKYPNYPLAYCLVEKDYPVEETKAWTIARIRNIKIQNRIDKIKVFQFLNILCYLAINSV